MERNLTSSCAYTRTRSFAPIAAARPSVTIREKCTPRRGKRARNARGIVKLAAVASKNRDRTDTAVSVFFFVKRWQNRESVIE